MLNDCDATNLPKWVYSRPTYSKLRIATELLIIKRQPSQLKYVSKLDEFV